MFKLKEKIYDFYKKNENLFFIKQLQILVFALKGLYKDNLSLMASALTLYTLLSIIPMVALIFAIAKGFGLENIVSNFILNHTGSQKEIAESIIIFAKKLLNNTKGGLIAGIGVLILLWSSTRLFDLIEKSFNIIWNIKKTRNIIRKTVDYIAILIIVPILITSGSSLLIILKVKFQKLLENLEVYGSIISLLIGLIISITPYLIIIFGIILLYILVPNTKIKFIPAMVSGIIAGSFLIVTSKIFFNMQIMIAKYNAIYGSLSFIPILLIYIQISWLIILMGTEICYANEYFENMQEYSLKDIPTIDKIKAGILIIKVIAKRFKKGLPPANYDVLSKISELPNRAIRELIDPLIKYKIITTSNDEKDEETFLPLKDIYSITVVDIIKAYIYYGNNNFNIQFNNKNNDSKIEAIINDMKISKNNVNVLEI